ncbi:membrane protein [Spirochaetia bacterium]|nr:membrane protein [Spirochaetia bacterium]
MLKKLRNNIFLLIRLALILAVLVNIIIIFVNFIRNPQPNEQEMFFQYSENIISIIVAIITFILSFGSDIIEIQQKIDIPDILEIVIIIFIYAGLFLSVQFNLYYTFFWWDDLLHTLSGVIIGFIGFIVVYKINYKYSMDISPLLVAFFSFTFAVTLGVLWEILEFSGDVLMGTAHQKWDLPDTAVMMGKSYQGSGLRDTMSDLIVDSIGAFITSVITYNMYKKRKKQTLDEMKKMIKDN